MATFKSDYANNFRQMPVARGSEVLSVRLEVSVTTALVSADLLQFGNLPEDHVPVDCILDCGDLDTGASMTLDVGLMTSAQSAISTAAADGDAVWISGSTVAQAGGMVRPTTRALWLVEPSATTKRMMGAKITAAAAGTAVAGVVALTVLYRAAHFGS